MPHEELPVHRDNQLWGWDALQGWEWHAGGPKSRNFFSWAWCHWEWPCNDTLTTAPPKRYQTAQKQAGSPARGGGQRALPAPQPRRRFPSDLNDKRLCLPEMLFKLRTPSSFSVHEFSLNSCWFFQCSRRLEIICLGSLMIIFYWVCESHRVVSVPWLNECNSWNHVFNNKCCIYKFIICKYSSGFF